jgi:aspartate carbamoyltransferase catalytic subunit
MEFLALLSRPVKKVPSLKETTIGNLFFEDSTRTRTSFELAEKRLGADVVNFSGSGSSVKKGESLIDTVKNLLRMKIDMIVMRHRYSGAAAFVYEQTKIPIINAGDGTNEHPTQALLDLFTLWNRGIRTEEMNIALLGDIQHSRVAGSLEKIFLKLNIKYKKFGPNTVQRQFSPGYKATNFDSQEYNILYNLRIQRERQNKELIPTLEEYHEHFGISKPKTYPGQIIMHPGPINRGVELDSETADSTDSIILDQVEMGVALRMAVLFLLGQKRGA